MIFGESYDRALWLMLKGDKKNRKRINDLISSIPYELYIEIKNKMGIVDENRKKNVFLINEEYFHNSYVKEDKLYFYRINPYNYGLSLGYSVLNNSNYDREFEITLCPLDKIDLDNKEDFIFVGTEEFNNESFSLENAKNVFISSGILEKTSFKFLVLLSSCQEILDVSIINKNSVPSELDFNKGYKLVKKKRRN